jgi:uncharacterized protein (DUF486 family)
VTTFLLLVISNIFMTIAWYGHLKYLPEGRFPLLVVIFLSWGVAFFEYVFQVPANRIGYRHFSATQLKIFQEIISLSVFALFAVLVLGERLHWNHLLAFVLMVMAAYLVVKPH